MDKQTFHIAYDDAPFGVALCTAEGVIEECNSVYTEMLGLSRDEVLGFNVLSDSNFSEQEREYIMRRPYFEMEFTRKHTEEFPTTRGKELCLKFRITRLMDGNDIVGYKVFAMEKPTASQESRAEQSTGEEEEPNDSYVGLVEDLPLNFTHAKLIFGKDGQIEDFINMRGNKRSREFCKIYGIKWGETRITEFTPTSGVMLMKHLNDIRNSGKRGGRFIYDVPEIKENVEMVAVLEGDEYLNMIAVPVTHLVRSEQMERIFLQNLSHDIRTPLNSIIGFSQILADPVFTPTAEEKAVILNQIRNSGEMLMVLFEDILNLSDVTHGKLKVEKQPTDINAMCRNLLSTMDGRRATGVELRYETDVADGTTVNTDGRRIQQVLSNYLSNACKHTHEGSITLRCSMNKGRLHMSVADTGEGVPEDMRELLFGRFVHRGQVDSHGIGLNICKMIAEAMHGTAYLDTTHCGGAKFDFDVPI